MSPPGEVPDRFLAADQQGQKRIARRITRAAKARVTAEKEWRAAILAAHEEGGWSLRRLGEFVGLTHTRVLQIIRQAREEAQREAEEER